ncbi:MAG: hypothetical protein ACPLZH_02100 [Minisyncoccales bacterium]
MPEKEPQFFKPEAVPERKEEKEIKEPINFLVKSEIFRERLREAAKITDQTGQESGFAWVLFKDEKIEITRVTEGIGDEIPAPAVYGKLMKDVFFYPPFPDNPEKGKRILIYGDVHFHPRPEKDDIIPSQADLETFVVTFSTKGKIEEDEEEREYLRKYWRGVGIVKEDGFIDLLLITGRIGRTDFRMLCKQLREAENFEEKQKLLKENFKVYYFENISKIRKKKNFFS